MIGRGESTSQDRKGKEKTIERKERPLLNDENRPDEKQRNVGEFGIKRERVVLIGEQNDGQTLTLWM